MWRRELWAIVNRLVKIEGMSVLLSTAYLDEAERCDEVVILYEGRVLGQGTPADFITRQTGRTYTVVHPGHGYGYGPSWGGYGWGPGYYPPGGVVVGPPVVIPDIPDIPDEPIAMPFD